MNASAPSRSRSPLDAVYAVLPTDTMATLAEVVKASDVERGGVQRVLRAAKAGLVADGINGKWSRTLCTRTKFRDGVVAGQLVDGGEQTFEDLVKALPVSRPQLYTTLARLQVAGRVRTVRDGSRTPVYAAI